MDIAAQLQQLVTRIPNRQAAFVSFLLIAFLCLVLLAQLTWLLIPLNRPILPWKPAIQSANQAPQQFLLEPLNGLFGKPGVKAATPAPQPVKEAPKTRLNLTLTGLVASNVPGKGAAIIEHKGNQDTYGEGDKISGTSAVVRQILEDRVILINSGVQETLMLDGETYTKAVPSSRQRYSEPEQDGGDGEEDLAEVLTDLKSSPDALAKITDYIRVSPVREGDELKGFRVNPGSKAELFAEMGLQPNDLAVALNGVDLTDMSQAMSIVGELQEMTELSLTVERDGQQHEIFFALPDAP